MRSGKVFGLVGVLLLGASLVVKADSWDAGGAFNDDNLGTTQNFLTHGTRQDHDLNPKFVPLVADLDYFRVPAFPLASYELIVDGASEGVGFDLDPTRLTRRDASDTVVQTAATFGNSLVLRWAAGGGTEDFIRVGAAACGTGCNVDAIYTIRFFETTVFVPRFNNSGSQVTVLLIQNGTDQPIQTDAYFHATDGTEVDHLQFPVAARGVLVTNLNTGDLVGQAGAITITHNAGYGGLVAKSIALEPATGFSFDSPGVYKPM